MSTEQLYALPDSDQPARQREGAIFVDGENVGIDIGDIARKKKIASALLDANTAAAPTQPLVETVEKKLEYTPLPQEKIREMGIRVVYGLRKPESENHINLFSDSESTAPYLYSKQTGQAEYITKSWNVTEQPQSSMQEENPKDASWKGFHEQSF